MPKLTRRGGGRGAGARFYWTDANVVDRAEIICNVLAATNSSDAAFLTLWFSGFEVSVTRVKAAWMRKLRGRKTSTANYDPLESQSDRFWVEAEKFEGKLAADNRLTLRDARAMAHLTLLAILGVGYVQPNPEELADLRNAIVNLVMPRNQANDIDIPPEWLSERHIEKLFSFVRAAASIEEERRQVRAASKPHLLEAQMFLRVLGRGIRALVLSTSDASQIAKAQIFLRKTGQGNLALKLSAADRAETDKWLENIRPKFAAAFGPIFLLFFLKLIGAGKDGILKRSAKIIDAFDRTGNWDEISRLINVWKDLDLFRLYNVT